MLRKEKIIFFKPFSIWLDISLTGIFCFIKRNINHFDAMLLGSMQMSPIQRLDMLCNSLIYFCSLPEAQRNTTE